MPRDYSEMWRFLRRTVSNMEEAALANLLSGTKEQFDGHKGKVEQVRLTQFVMIDIERRAADGTLEETDDGPGAATPRTSDDD
jgi:hypothetical protein